MNKELIQKIVDAEYGVPEGAEVGVVLAGAPDHFQGTLESEEGALRMLARVGEIELGGSLAGPGAHGVLVDGTELFLPLEGVIDLDREMERLRGEIQRLEGQHHGTVKKLENRSFVEKAPAEVVEREREKAASLREQLEKLQEKLRAFEGA